MMPTLFLEIYHTQFNNGTPRFLLLTVRLSDEADQIARDFVDGPEGAMRHVDERNTERWELKAAVEEHRETLVGLLECYGVVGSCYVEYWIRKG